MIGAHATALGLGEHASQLKPALPGIAFERPEVRLVSTARLWLRAAAWHRSWLSSRPTRRATSLKSQATQLGGEPTTSSTPTG